MTHRMAHLLLLSAALALGGGTAAAQQGDANTLTAAERDAGWQLLFDGTSTGAWRGYRSEAMPEGWQVSDGVLRKVGSTNDIVTRDRFGDFELVLDWRLELGGNAGLFYRVTEEYPKPYWSGPEYQLLDDPNHPDGRNRLTSVGAAYGLYPSPEGIEHPAGEWNTTRIVVRGTHVEHWLNDTRLLVYELGSADWRAKVAASKFAAWPNYGLATSGQIAIQGDHNGELALRNIKILVR